MHEFLSELTPRPIRLPSTSGLADARLFVGQGSSALEVVVCNSAEAPRLPHLRSAWKARQGGRAAPLLIAVLHGERATLCGPVGDDPPTYPNVEPGQAERICREALEQADRHAALRSLRDALPSVEARLPGIRNEGFLATHELAEGFRRSAEGRAQWEDASGKARRAIGQQGEAMLRSLGFKIERLDQVTSVLRVGDDGHKLAAAVFLKQDESPELRADRFSSLSPVSYALAVADRENIPYVLIMQGSKLRLYPVKVGVGVGRRGRAETYLEVHTGLLRDTDAAYLWLLFSADALRENGSLAGLLEESRRFAGDLAERLRDRIYGSVVPRLAEGIAAARGLRKPSAKDLAETYEMAMTVLFRLLFVAYAEDKDLLPYKLNGLYQSRSLKQKAQELLELRRAAVREGTGEVPFDTNSDAIWAECDAIFRAVEGGNRNWGVPAYNGGLFSRKPEVSKVGAALADLSLPNTIMGPVLSDLLCIESNAAEGWGPVDFRSLGVREFGTIYEGLLESELSVAETDLAVDSDSMYREAKATEEPLVRKGRVYLHNKSGARRESGSYFTKSFAVEHLLDHALEPALSDHLSRLDALSNEDSAQQFFDFRVADIAMGSAHFLVAAVDRIERGLTGYLSRRPLAGVRSELAKLRASAEEALGSLAEQVEIEDTQLLRRLIARRCIYGVDMNPISVALARVSIWIHTFVPGLPLSLLDHNLVVGNSLVGIGTIEELRDIATPDRSILFTLDAQELIGDALSPLQKLAMITDATAAEVTRARSALKEAQASVESAKALCDIATVARMKGEALPVDLGDWKSLRGSIVDSRAHKAARKALGTLSILHFPVAFPEVFLRPRSGFDVILGNPPWEEVTVEQDRFWNAYVPGLQAMRQHQQEEIKASMRDTRPDLYAQFVQTQENTEQLRKLLLSGPYPGMGTGDPDLYKAFCWRFWHLIAEKSGRIGIVLPRSAFSAKGSSAFREALFKSSSIEELCYLINDGGWVFDDAEPRYTIALVGIVRGVPASARVVRLRGPFRSLERFERTGKQAPVQFTVEEVLTWTDTAALPLLPAEGSASVFARMRKAPRLDSREDGDWFARPHRELDATNDKSLMVLTADRPPRHWPVFKGESFDLWEPDRDAYYAWADPKTMVKHLADKRFRGRTRGNSVWFEFADRPKRWFEDEKTLPCFSPRIAFKDVVRNTDSRTMKACLVPSKIVITNAAPYLLWPRGTTQDEAYLLGVFCSLPLDWYARRFVELHMNFFILNAFPIPRPHEDNPLRRRVIEVAGRLAASENRFESWAELVGVECGPLDVDQKWDLMCELDAVVAHLYMLDEEHLQHVFETFHEGWGPGRTADHATLGEYDDRLKRTLRHYRDWTKKAFPTAYQHAKKMITHATAGKRGADDEPTAAGGRR